MGLYRAKLEDSLETLVRQTWGCGITKGEAGG